MTRYAVVPLLLLLPACATTMSPEQARVDGWAQECLRLRNRDVLNHAEVDSFGRVMVSGRRTTEWNAERNAFWDCMEAKGFRIRNRPGPPVLK